MSILLPNNKAEKFARLDMLVNQGSISYKQALQAYIQYCRLYDARCTKLQGNLTK